MIGAAERNVNLVHRINALLRISKFPPVLVAYYCNLKGGAWLGRVLDSEDHARRREKDHDNDEDRNDSPGQLDLIASVDLRRLALLVSRTRSVADHDIGEQAANDDENRTRNSKNEHAQLVQLR